ncbi:hypothetical protein MTO96_043084 [Rhipicephalus appendiculatus]
MYSTQAKGFNYGIANRGDSIVSRFGLVCNRRYLLNLRIGVAVTVSGLVSPLLGLASDRVGHRPVTLASVVVLLASTVANSVAGTFAFYLSSRTVVLTTAKAVFVLTFILLYEVTGNDWNRAGHWYTESSSPPTAILAVWCYLLRESPTWLLATWDVKHAHEAALEAASINGLDTVKAGATVRAILVQVTKLHRCPPPSTGLAATDGPVQSARMRRRAASVFLARLTLSAMYFPLTATGRSVGYYWAAVNALLLAASYVAVGGAVVKRGLRDTLTVLLVVVCAFSAVQTLLMTVGGVQLVASAVHAGLKVALSGAMSVVLSYSAEVFPTRIRCAGVSVSLFFGSAGSLLGALLYAMNGQRAGILFHATATILTALSVFAVQWLPEVLVYTCKTKRRSVPASAQERKEALKQSLAPPIDGGKRTRRRKGKSQTPPKTSS